MYDALIVNPIAGSGYALKVLEQLESGMKSRGLPYRVFRTEGPAHATELARSLAAEEEVRSVISVGGDGTAFEVAGGLAGSGKPMGIIPAGTGNDFIKTAGIPKDPMQALEVILRQQPAPVDLGALNEGCFLNVCGTGFDVMVLDCAQQLKSRFRGLLPYFLGLLKAISGYHPVHLRLTVDGKEEEGDYLICSVANGRIFGGGIPICPEADLEDGKLDLVLVQSVPRWRIPFYLPGLLLGRVLHFRITRHLRVEHVLLQGRGLRVNVDGEIFPMDRAEFSPRPGALMLLR